MKLIHANDGQLPHWRPDASCCNIEEKEPGPKPELTDNEDEVTCPGCIRILLGRRIDALEKKLDDHLCNDHPSDDDLDQDW